MRLCQFYIEAIPEDYDWQIKGTFNEEVCCGKPATCSVEEGGWTYWLCAEHYDHITSLDRASLFAGEEIDRIFIPND